MSVLLPLADAQDYAALIGPVPTGGIDVDRLCQAASAKIRAYCGWLIGPSQDETLTVDGTGGYRLLLPTLYLSAVTSVTDSGTVLDLSFIDYSAQGWLEWARPQTWFTRPLGYPGVFSVRSRGVVAAVTHGYADVPDDVAMLACSMVARQLASPSGDLHEQVGQVSVAHSQVAPNQAGGITLLAHEMAALGAYRIPRVL